MNVMVVLATVVCARELVSFHVSCEKDANSSDAALEVVAWIFSKKEINF